MQKLFIYRITICNSSRVILQEPVSRLIPATAFNHARRKNAFARGCFTGEEKNRIKSISPFLRPSDFDRKGSNKSRLIHTIIHVNVITEIERTGENICTRTLYRSLDARSPSRSIFRSFRRVCIFSRGGGFPQIISTLRIYFSSLQGANLKMPVRVNGVRNKSRAEWIRDASRIVYSPRDTGNAVDKFYS